MHGKIKQVSPPFAVDRLRADLKRIIRGREGQAKFIDYVTQYVQLKVRVLADDRTTSAEARRRMRRVLKHAQALFNVLSPGKSDRSFQMELHKGYRSTGGTEYLTGEDQFWFDPTKQVEDLLGAAGFLVAAYRRHGKTQAGSRKRVGVLSNIAAAFGYYLKRKPSEHKETLFYQVCEAVLMHAGIVIEDLRPLLVDAIKQRPSHPERWST